MELPREIVVPTRLNEDEAQRLDKARRANGLTRSAYVRMALLEKLTREDAAAAPPPPAPAIVNGSPLVATDSPLQPC
ncbi:MAG: ribbon-helix-helix protein, CopG family [Ktedonobacteraceae bacterium]|nr:ribbon-helix-helix protein, CopG family [Ktedonobacteraceae bacterium]MBA3915166.1 ribbon-helix-helix protein, CopG family [Terriglobales bacterium]